jgi:hypothetical protein
MSKSKKGKRNPNYQVEATYHEPKKYELSEFLRDVFDVLFGWNWDMAYKPFKVLSLVVVRLFIYFIGNKYYDSHLIHVERFFSGNFLGDTLLVILALYGLFHVFGTIGMMIYIFKFGNWESSGEPDLSEVKKLKEWRDNKMKFMSYEDSMKLMRDTSILNNLDSNSEYPEAKKTLSYINNKMRFMSYPDAVKFLRGDKK